VDVRCAALSNFTGFSSFLHVTTHDPWSGLRRREYPPGAQTESIEVRVEKLDESLPDGYVPQFIKIDVEGPEKEVLEGGMETLRRHGRTVLFEHGKGAADWYGTAPGHVFDLLSEANLRVFDTGGNGPYSRDGFEEMFEQNLYWNFVAHP
jgi:hypothetical protein